MAKKDSNPERSNGTEKFVMVKNVYGVRVATHAWEPMFSKGRIHLCAVSLWK